MVALLDSVFVFPLRYISNYVLHSLGLYEDWVETADMGYGSTKNCKLAVNQIENWKKKIAETMTQSTPLFRTRWWNNGVGYMSCYVLVIEWLFYKGKQLAHDDVIKWKHFPRYWPFVQGIHRSPVNSPHKGQWRGALMFYLIFARINGWVNNHEDAIALIMTSL